MCNTARSKSTEIQVTSSQLPKNFPRRSLMGPLLSFSPNSPWTWEHLNRPCGSRRQVSIALTCAQRTCTANVPFLSINTAVCLTCPVVDKEGQLFQDTSDVTKTFLMIN